jgi:hypothetical protein
MEFTNYILEAAGVSDVDIMDIEVTQAMAEMAVLEAMMDCYEKQMVLLEYNEDSADEIFTESETFVPAMENDYFKVYYKPNAGSSSINLFIEGIRDDKKSIVISKVDADTPGYLTDVSFSGRVPLYEHNTEQISLSYYPCEDNMSYLMIYYSIYDENNNIIEDKQIATKYFDSPQYIGKECK